MIYHLLAVDNDVHYVIESLTIGTSCFVAALRVEGVVSVGTVDVGLGRQLFSVCVVAVQSFVAHSVKAYSSDDASVDTPGIHPGMDGDHAGTDFLPGLCSRNHDVVGTAFQRNHKYHAILVAAAMEGCVLYVCFVQQNPAVDVVIRPSCATCYQCPDEVCSLLTDLVYVRCRALHVPFLPQGVGDILHYLPVEVLPHHQLPCRSLIQLSPHSAMELVCRRDLLLPRRALHPSRLDGKSCISWLYEPCKRFHYLQALGVP